ncbi:substrate-binding domain-containing protein [Mediterraneibacter sp. NSJ-55]|uniref:Substrate-binding domain-containing protein n=1 Tax=Mediterraneibacter hominis TaxID=2763054 RepID=A0A923LJL4_9FIRM|nr:substrate-binding domain-containing protein [Mediterraneibacter hominis]MBC5689513.1 substrate-binding domain-containing protein [Mediterraneibacter hominis]
MRKKMISILLCAAMAVTMAAGCSGGESGNTGGSDSKEQSSAEQEKGSGETAAAAEGSFDEFTRPNIKSADEIKVAYMHTKPEVESQSRSILQSQLEADNRGWEYAEYTYQEDSEWADIFRNLMNQGVDAIIIGSTESMEAKVDLIAEARNMGIGVYSNDNQVVPGVIMNSTMPNGTAAMSLIYQIGNDIGWSGAIGFSTMASIQVHNERILPIQSICDIYSNLSVLETIDAVAGGTDQPTYVNESAKALMQQYGTEMKGWIGSCDYIAMPVAEAAEQSADLIDPDFFVAGIDGGSDCWSYIRSGSYMKYSYAQPFEMFTHKVFEAIEDIQVEGLNPGDEGCIISTPGEVLYSEGVVITQDNVPEPGSNINSVFDYYDDDPDAWYNWEGTYTVKE